MTPPTLRLTVGSDTLGYEDIPTDGLGEMTRAMPGGDGSLEWTLTREEVRAARNVLQPGARVILRANGVAVWGGRYCDDGARHLLTIPDVLSCAAGGLNSWAARRQDCARPWIIADPYDSLIRITRRWTGTDWDEMTDQGKFTVNLDGRLLIRGDKDRTYTAYSSGTVAFRLMDGLDVGWRIYGADITYKSNMPTNWRLTVRGGDDEPWSVAGNSAYSLSVNDSTSRSTAHTETMDWAAGVRSLAFALNFNSSSDGSPATDPWVNVTSITLYCRQEGGTTDRTITLDVGLCDIATLPGLATVTRVATIGTDLASLVVDADLPVTPADALRTVAEMYTTGEVEYGFDVDAAGADRFTCGPRPASVDWSRNVHWDYGGRAGEDVSGLARDMEAAPDFVRLMYLAKDRAGIPAGSVVSYVYPTSGLTTWDQNLQTNTDLAETKVAEADAALSAAKLWSRLQAQQWSGTFPIPLVMVDTRGVVHGGWEVRPGDRVSIPTRLGATDLYVSETSWDWSTLTGTGTVGWPFATTAGVSKSDYKHLTTGGVRPWSPTGLRAY